MKTEFYGTLVFSRKPSGRLRHFAQYEVPVQQEDGGQAWIAEFGGPEDEGMFVRLQSWDSTGSHEHMRELLDKRIRITVEVLD